MVTAAPDDVSVMYGFMNDPAIGIEISIEQIGKYLGLHTCSNLSGF